MNKEEEERKKYKKETDPSKGEMTEEEMQTAWAMTWPRGWVVLEEVWEENSMNKAKKDETLLNFPGCLW